MKYFINHLNNSNIISSNNKKKLCNETFTDFELFKLGDENYLPPSHSLFNFTTLQKLI